MVIFNSYVKLPEGTGAFYVGLLDGLLGVAGMITDSYCGSFPKIPCV